MPLISIVRRRMFLTFHGYGTRQRIWVCSSFAATEPARSHRAATALTSAVKRASIVALNTWGIGSNESSSPPVPLAL